MLKILRIDGDHSLHDFPATLVRMVRSFQLLEKLILAPSAMTYQMVVGVSGMKTITHVQVAEFGRTPQRGTHSDTSSAIAKPIYFSSKQSFQNLQYFAFTASSSLSAIGIFSDVNFPAGNLLDVWIRFPKATCIQPAGIYKLLVYMKRRCGSLERLTLRISFQHDWELEDKKLPVEYMTYHHFSPCFDFPSLTEFTVDHSLPLQLTDDDMAQIAQRATRFRKLWLNPYPIADTTPKLTLDCLIPLARHCHEMQSLGLYLATDISCVARVTPRFHALRNLFVGSSKVYALTSEDDHHSNIIWEDIAIFLVSVLPSWTIITHIAHYLDMNPWNAICHDVRFPSEDGWEEHDASKSSNSWSCVYGLSQFLRHHKVADVLFPCECSNCEVM